jgi:hypothetical protein
VDRSAPRGRACSGRRRIRDRARAKRHVEPGPVLFAEVATMAYAHSHVSRRRLIGVGAVLGVALAGCSSANAPQRSTEGLVAWPADDLWPEQFNRSSSDVQEAYRYAVGNEDVLQWMPCFCGCGAGGHRSNFDCYVREVRDDGSVALDAMSFG